MSVGSPTDTVTPIDGPVSLAKHDNNVDSHDPQSRARSEKGFKFWMVIFGLLLAALMSGLDGSISTALPTIANEFNLGPDFVWVLNAYFLTSAVVQPLLAQLSDLWGRRWIFISAVAIFVLGSGLIAGSSSGQMLIASRAVQGVGAGGINMMIDLIICDLVPLRERGNYIGMVFGSAITIAGFGPLIGGALASAGAWRWIFWLNLPIGGLCMAIMLAFLRVSSRSDHASTGNSDGETLFKRALHKAQRIDWVGNALIIASTTSSLWALAYGGASKSWADPGVVAALVCGFVGLILFVIWEGSPRCFSPLVPLRLFRNRTSAVAFFLSFTNTILIYWVNYMLPVYFQAVLGAPAQQSGLWLLPFSLAFPVGAALAGFMLSKLGRYKPIHLATSALCTIFCGVCSILDAHSSEASWVILQIFLSFIISAPSATLLPAIQAPLAESDAATSTGTWAFVRSLGSIWSVAIPAAIFNSRFGQLLDTIDSESARAALNDGQAYAHASSTLVGDFADNTREQVIHVYTLSLQRTWQIAILFAGVSMVTVLIERQISLRDELVTDFGLEKRNTGEVEGLQNTEGGRLAPAPFSGADEHK